MPNTSVPFYPNTSDNSHCVQAVFRMLLKHYFPKERYTLRDIDRITWKRGKLGTWLVPGLMYLMRRGVEVVEIGDFDYAKLHKDPDYYLRKTYSPTVARWYLKNSNIREVVKFVPRFLRVARVQKRRPTIDELRIFLDRGYLVAVDLNGSLLNGYHDYTSHLVLVTGYDPGALHLHDPGLPPRPHRRISIRLFRKAWSKTHGSGPNLTAFRR